MIGIVTLATLLPLSVQALDWDQTRATELATTMHQSIEAMLADPGIDPRQQTTIQQRNHSAALMVLKDMSVVLARLREMLADGRGRVPTQPVFEQLVELRSQVGDFAADSWIMASAQAKGQAFTVAFTALGDYYKD